MSEKFNPKRFTESPKSSEHTRAEIDQAESDRYDEWVNKTVEEANVDNKPDFDAETAYEAAEQAREQERLAQVEERILSNPNARRMYMVAQNIAELAASGSNSLSPEALQQVVAEKEDKLQELIENYLEGADAERDSVIANAEQERSTVKGDRIRIEKQVTAEEEYAKRLEEVDLIIASTRSDEKGKDKKNKPSATTDSEINYKNLTKEEKEYLVDEINGWHDQLKQTYYSSDNDTIKAGFARFKEALLKDGGMSADELRELLSEADKVYESRRQSTTETTAPTPLTDAYYAELEEQRRRDDADRKAAAEAEAELEAASKEDELEDEMADEQARRFTAPSGYADKPTEVITAAEVQAEQSVRKDPAAMAKRALGRILRKVPIEKITNNERARRVSGGFGLAVSRFQDFLGNSKDKVWDDRTRNQRIAIGLGAATAVVAGVAYWALYGRNGGDTASVATTAAEIKVPDPKNLQDAADRAREAVEAAPAPTEVADALSAFPAEPPVIRPGQGLIELASQYGFSEQEYKDYNLGELFLTNHPEWVYTEGGDVRIGASGGSVTPKDVHEMMILARVLRGEA